MGGWMFGSGRNACWREKLMFTEEMNVCNRNAYPQQKCIFPTTV